MARPERLSHADAFEDWFKLTRAASWQSYRDTKALFGQTDVTSDTKSHRTATIFDIGGNKYRIICLIDYLRQPFSLLMYWNRKNMIKANGSAQSNKVTTMPTAAKNKHPSHLDPYMALIRRLPLAPIKDDAHHDQAVEIIEELIGLPCDTGTSDYLDTLILLVNKYEDEHHTPEGTALSPQEALRAIMNANGLSQAYIGKIIGSESVVSMFLKGERELSKAHIRSLVARFRVDANLFL